MNNSKAYETITARIIEQLEKGIAPWRKPWNASAGGFQNLDGNRYRGINVMLLAMTGYSDPRFGTFKAIKAKGGYVRKGEKGMPIIFWSWVTKENKDTGEEETYPILKQYTVFNVEQTEGLDLAPLNNEPKPFNAIEAAETIVANMPNKPSVDHDGGDRAFFIPRLDEVHMPKHEYFDGEEEYYSTLFHELGHSTGHTSRLNRHGMETGIAAFGSPVYSREELAAEFTSAFLCFESGIENTIENSANYIGGWLKALRSDTRMAVIAAAQGQKAASYIMGGKSEENQG